MTDGPKRIKYVWNHREWGGGQIYFLSLMKVAGAHHSVSAVLPENSGEIILGYLRRLDVPFTFLPSAPPLVNPSGIISKLRLKIARLRSESNLVRSLIQRDGSDRTILHVDLGFWQSFLPLFRLTRRMHVVMTMHTALPRSSRWRRSLWRVKGRLLTRSPRFHLTASNEHARESLREYVTPESFAHIAVAYSGFDAAEIDAAKANPDRDGIRDRYGLPLDAPLVVCVGQFIARKGCWVLLDALRALAGVGVEFTCMWVTTAFVEPADKVRVDAFALGGAFRLVEPAEFGGARHDLLALMGASDMFVLPSFEEGLPIALVEAMALGLPCISTRVNAIPEAIMHNETGLLVRPGDAGELAAAIKLLLADSQLGSKLAAAGERFARDNFDARLGAEVTLELYNSLLANSSAKNVESQ